MANITRVDTDGVRSILDIGQLAVDSYTDGNDAGRIWTGNGTINRALAFKDELDSSSSNTSIEAKSYNELNSITPTDNTIYWYTDEKVYVYGNTDTSTWKYFSNNSDIKKIGTGTGVAGTWIESWEVPNDATTNWASDDFGNLQSGSDNGKWNRHKNNTSSSGTGPSSAYDGDWYLYAEMSSNGHNNIFNLSTTNFARLTQVRFKFHMNGGNCGTFKLVTKNSGVSTEQFSVTHSQGDQWNDVTIDVSDSQAEEIEFIYSGSSGWQSDLALDKIEITSI